MIIEVGGYFEKGFNRKLENCATYVRCRSKEQDRNMNTYFPGLNSWGPLGVSEKPPLLSPPWWYRCREGGRNILKREISMVKGQFK